MPDEEACPICFEDYEADRGKIARRLSCGHEACNICLLELFSEGSVCCPTCFQECSFDATDIPGAAHGSTVLSVNISTSEAVTESDYSLQKMECPICFEKFCGDRDSLVPRVLPT